MSTVAEIEQAIRQLTPEEFKALRDWILERDAVEWDRQIEADSKAGKLNELVEAAKREHLAGRSRPL